ncbi:MAG: hypothetical protein RUDDFDWM_000328 [Candidatus Fervidibacterota bacterium]
MSLVKQLASVIDMSMLHPTLRQEEIERGCMEAVRWGFACVFVLPCWVKFASKLLYEGSVAVGTVVGFPLGGNESSVKAFETKKAIHDGASEIDMVINIGMLKSGNDEAVIDDIKAVVEAAREASENVGSKAPLIKVILETGYLSEDEIRRACELAMASGADFVKTSTGFGPKGATVDDVRLMRRVVGNKMRIKAAGGIRTLHQTLELLDAGADRIGTSHAVDILREAQQHSAQEVD